MTAERAIASVEIDPDHMILVSEDEIHTLDAKFDNIGSVDNNNYEDLLRHYMDRSYDKAGMKLKSVMTGRFSPRTLGLRNVDSKSNVSDVITCYRERMRNTLLSISARRHTQDIGSLSREGVYGYSDKWFIYIDTDGGYISVGPLKNEKQATNMKYHIEAYRSGLCNTISAVRNIMRINRVHPSIRGIIDGIFPDQ